MPCAATRDSSVRTTASTSSSLLGRQPTETPTRPESAWWLAKEKTE